MITTGKVVALIQAMGSSADPAVIESAVQDWLDDHPEATTTVADGSITEQKLAAAVAAKINQVSQLSDEIDTIREIKHGINMWNPSEAESGKYLESNGTTIDNAEYDLSGFIPVEVGKTYFFACIAADQTIARTRHLAMLYNADKQPISSTYINSDNVSGITITVSDENAVYMRCCGHAQGTNRLMQVQEGNTFTYYQPYIAIVENKMELPQLTPYEPLQGLATKESTENLLGIDNLSTGFLYYTGVIDASSSGYRTTDFIPVNADQAYTLVLIDSYGQMITDNRITYMLYDQYKNPIMTMYHNVSPETNTTITPITAGYIRVCLTTNNMTKYGMLVKGTNLPSAYSAHYAYYQLAENTFLPANAVANILQGKKWAVCGDSFTAYTNKQFESGQYAGKDRVYSRLIAERNNMNLLELFMASGRTLAYPADGTFENSLTNPNAAYYYQNIPADVDYITIMLGINDGHHANGTSGTDGEDVTGVIPIGTIDDATTATYYGAWNVVIPWLMENRPFAHIGIIVSNGCDSVDYRTAQIEIAKKYGIAYIDLNGDSRTPAMIRSQNPDISSVAKNILYTKQRVDSTNSHPNWQAHEYESTFIENFLRSI